MHTGFNPHLWWDSGLFQGGQSSCSDFPIDLRHWKSLGCRQDNEGFIAQWGVEMGRAKFLWSPKDILSYSGSLECAFARLRLLKRQQEKRIWHCCFHGWSSGRLGNLQLGGCFAKCKQEGSFCMNKMKGGSAKLGIAGVYRGEHSLWNRKGILLEILGQL